MINLKSSLVLLTVVFISACSNTTPKIVSDLGEMELPVVQPAPSNDVSKQKIVLTYQENEKIIHELERFLEERYLSGTAKEDTFKEHSLPHQVYKSLTTLEQAELINTQYYSEGNADGLEKLRELLHPYTEVIK